MVSLPGQEVPQGLTTYEALQYQLAQQKKQQQAQQKAVDDKAYFDTVQAQFRKDQADAKAKGQVLTSQTITTDEQGRGTIESNYANQSTYGHSSLDQNILPGRYQPDAIVLGAAQRVAPTGAQSAKANADYLSNLTSGTPERGKPLPAGYEYANPTYNEYFGTRRIGDIVSEEVAKGNKGYYAPRETYDYNDVKDYLAKSGSSSNTRKAYYVNLEDRLDGGPYRYEVQLNDSLSGRGPSARTQEARIATAGTEPNFFEGFIAGGGNYLSNIPRTFQGLYDPSVKFAPEVEGSVFNIFGTAGKNFFEGKPQTFFEDFGTVGKQIKESPGYAAGSLAGTAGFTALTFGFGEIPSLLGKGIRSAVTVGRAVKVERDIIPGIEKGLGPEGRAGMDLDRIISIGTESAPSKVSVMRPTTLGPSKVEAQEIFHTYPLEAPKTAGKINADLILGKPERVTTYTQSFVKIGDRELPLGAIKKTSSSAITETFPKLSGNPKDVTEPLSFIRQTGIESIDIPAKSPLARGANVFDIESGIRGENIFVKTTPYDKVVATSETATNREIFDLLQTDKGKKSLLGGGSTDDFFRVEPSGNKPSSPLRFEPEAKPQVTAETVRELPPASSGGASKSPSTLVDDAMRAGLSNFIGTGLGRQRASNASGVSLGFGGATGAERKQAKVPINDDVYEIIRTPQVGSKSSVFSLIDGMSAPKTSTRGQTKQVIDFSLTPSIASRQNAREDILSGILPGFSQGSKQESRQAASPLVDVFQVQSSRTVQSTRQETRQRTSFDIFDVSRVPIPNEPTSRTFSFGLGFSPGPEPKKGRGKKRKIRYGELTFKPIELFPGSPLAKMLPLE